jgi:hypothetical protein
MHGTPKPIPWQISFVSLDKNRPDGLPKNPLVSYSPVESEWQVPDICAE